MRRATVLCLIYSCGAPMVDPANGDPGGLTETPDTDAPCSSVIWFPDEDGDGFGDSGSPGEPGCLDPEGREGFAWNAGDCQDQDAEINPTVAEVCDGMDNNCNGLADDGLDLFPFYPDTDLDGFGAFGSVPSFFCGPREGWATNDNDCADHDARAFGGQTEFFDTPIAGFHDAIAFDFDCNGINELERTVLKVCESIAINECLPPPQGVVEGWAHWVPECGKEGWWNPSECRWMVNPDNGQEMCWSENRHLVAQSCR